MKNSSREQAGTNNFTSQLGGILAASGSAIGIGNVWRFSYVVGINGGGAFLLVYLVCVALVGLPLMMAEMSVGRKTRKSAVAAMKEIAPKSFWWIAGVVAVLASFMIMAYYPLVAGWSLGYMYESLINWNLMISDTAGFFSSYISSDVKPLIALGIVLIMTAFTIAGGAKGIEKWNKVLMPVLILIIILLIIRSLTLPGSFKGLVFLFSPDFSKITVSTFLDALGHGFFSLSVGMAAMITYGSYVRKEDDVVKCSFTVCTLDTVTALMAGIAIFPAVFALGLDPDSGKGLAFITLPKAFASMPGGRIFSVLFFLLLTIAALATMMSLLEVLTAFVSEEFNIDKKKLLIVFVILLFIIGIPASLSFSSMAEFKLFGLTYFDFMDKFSANVIVPIAGLFTALFVVISFGANNSKGELAKGCKKPNGILLRSYPVLIKYVVPISIIIILLNATGIFTKIFK